jgi:hypothetical protein
MLVSLLALFAPAHAATPTELPPMLRGDVTLGYAFDTVRGSLREETDASSVEVSQRALVTHRLRYRADFTAGPGVGVFLELPHWLSQRVEHSESNALVFDPGTGTGTMIGTNPLADASLSGSGVGGVWLGVRGTPWSEQFKDRNRVTWLLEAALRTADDSNFQGGKTRGAGPGGQAWRVHSAFSRTMGDHTPYLSASWTHEGAVKTDTFSADGTPLAQGVEVDPADTLRIRLGAENVASRQKESGAELRFDLHGTLDYATPSTVPSGLYLPQALSNTEGTAVQQAEQLRAGAGLGLAWRPMTYLEFRLWGDAAAQLPQRIEHPYPVRTGFDTLVASTGIDMNVRVR